MTRRNTAQRALAVLAGAASLALMCALSAATPAAAAHAPLTGNSASLAGGPAGQPADQPTQLTTTQQAWQDQVIYLVMTDRFYDGDKSNDQDVRPTDPSAYHGGDLQGVIDKLPYLKDLGVTTIWITPVVQNQAGGYHGYWATDLKTVDPHLGTWEKLHELTDKAHGQGMKVLLDVVVNHTGDKHPWVYDSAHQGWFHPQANIDFNNQQSIENGWLAGLPDWNTENPDVQKYLVDMSNFWLDKSGVDGFRMDTARHVPTTFWQNVYVPAVKQHKPDFWMVGEVWDTQHYDYLAKYQAAGIDAVFDFPLYQTITNVFGQDAPIGQLTGDNNLAHKFTPRPSQLVSFVDNHDTMRFVNAAKNQRTARLKEALTFLLTYQDIPSLYYGTEIGMAGGKDPMNRQDMLWTADGKPAQNPDVYGLTKQLIALRKQHVALRRGSYMELLDANTALAYGRVQDRDTVVTVINNADQPLTKAVPVANLNLADGTVLQDALSGARVQVTGGTFTPNTPARMGQVWVVAPSGWAALTERLGNGGLWGVLFLVLFGAGGWYMWRRGRRAGRV